MRLKSRCPYLIVFLLPLCCFAAERVEVASTWGFSVPKLQEYLDDEGMNLEVVNCDFRHYPGLLKPKTRLEKLKAKFSLFKQKKAQVDPDVKKIVFFNIPKGLKFSQLPEESSILFMLEPPLRLRKMYKAKVQKAFGRIYTFNDDLVDNKKYFKFHYPVHRPMIDDVVPFEQKKLLTMVVGHTPDNKKERPEALYIHREEAIRFFETKNESDFAFYGTNWDPARYRSYKGTIPSGSSSKIAVMKGYRFAICYENCNDVNGYITEKIFDCFAAGIVPIYWGAPNITDYIPRTCFIDRRDFPDLETLYSYLTTMNQEEYDTYIENIRTYLQSPEAQPFTPAHFRHTLSSALRN